jgi:hypothetical protein
VLNDMSFEVDGFAKVFSGGRYTGCLSGAASMSCTPCGLSLPLSSLMYLIDKKGTLAICFPKFLHFHVHTYDAVQVEQGSVVLEIQLHGADN